MCKYEFLRLTWSVSRGRDTYGYNIARLDSRARRYRCSGGGYDMVGAVFGQYLQAEHQERLRTIADRLSSWSKETGFVKNEKPDALYGGTVYADGSVRLDGSCGLSTMERIADACGIIVVKDYDRRGRQLLGFLVSFDEA